MNDSTTCLRREASLNELLGDPLIALVMTSDGVRSDDIRALFRRMEQQDKARDGAKSRNRVALEGCVTP